MQPRFDALLKKQIIKGKYSQADIQKAKDVALPVVTLS